MKLKTTKTKALLNIAKAIDAFLEKFPEKKNTNYYGLFMPYNEHWSAKTLSGKITVVMLNPDVFELTDVNFYNIINGIHLSHVNKNGCLADNIKKALHQSIDPDIEKWLADNKTVQNHNEVSYER